MTKILSEEIVLEKKLFKIIKSDFRADGGQIKTHYDIERLPTVSIFPITKNYEIYLISQYRPLYDSTIFEGIAGYLEKNEDPLDGAKRELKEETGITASEWLDMGMVHMSASVIKAESYMFIAKDLKLGTDDPDEGETIELIKIPLNKAVEKVMNNEITISISKLGILMIDKLRREGKI